MPANLVEIFSSIQGEGSLIGLRQIFLRFQECNLACIYCDTGRTAHSGYCSVEGTPGRRDFTPVKNPVSIELVENVLDKWQKGWPGIHHSISLTGGEPLVYQEVLSKWLPTLKRWLPIYLETNGTLPASLSSLIEHIDHVGMDIKLPSTSGHPEMWETHREFLTLAAQKNVFVKIVMDNTTGNWEIIRSCELISSINASIPLVLQPLTTQSGEVGISPIRLLELHEIATRFLKEVRIIPQTHKFLGLL